MDKNVKLVIKVEFQYFGEIVGSIPYLKICYQDKNSIISPAKGLKKLFCNRPQYFEKCHALNKLLEKYQSPYLTFQYDDGFLDCIGIDQNLLNNIPYNDNLFIISKLITDLYYDFNGDKVGFNIESEYKDLLSIYINRSKLDLPNKFFDFEKYDELIISIMSTFNVILNNFSATAANGIQNHRGINI